MRQDVSGWAQNYVGTKYRYAGTAPSTGFDCSGFVSHVFKEFDVKITSSSSGQSNLGVKIPLKQAQPGDLVFFSHGNGRGIQHVALCVSNEDGKLVVCHSTNTRGVIVEDVYESDYWRKRLLFARDIISPRFMQGVNGEK